MRTETALDSTGLKKIAKVLEGVPVDQWSYQLKFQAAWEALRLEYQPSTVVDLSQLKEFSVKELSGLSIWTMSPRLQQPSMTSRATTTSNKPSKQRQSSMQSLSPYVKRSFPYMSEWATPTLRPCAML